MSTFNITYSTPDSNGIVTVTIVRTAGTGNETLTLTAADLGGTSTLNSDYTIAGLPLTLTFSSGGQTPVTTQTFQFDMNADGITEGSESLVFNFTSTKTTPTYTGSGNTFTITDAIECFMPGTMIGTPNGDVAVETLKIGDIVLTHDGRAEAIRWMGRHTVSSVFGDRLKTLPIRIRAGALDDNVPSRDLLVSPGHAMLVDGALVQAAALVNGTSIVQESDVPQSFTYHHIELAGHALVMAENAPAETFVDNVERERFDNYAEYVALYPDAQPIVEMDLPLARAHRQVASATRRRLNQRGIALYGKAVAIAG